MHLRASIRNAVLLSDQIISVILNLRKEIQYHYHAMYDTFWMMCRPKQRKSYIIQLSLERIRRFLQLLVHLL